MQLKDHLLKLASLSEIESKIFKAKSQLETLQSHLRGLEEQLQQTQVSLAQKTKLSETHHQNQQNIIRFLEESKEHTKQRETRLYEIKTTKEYQAALKEIATAKREHVSKDAELQKLSTSLETLKAETAELEEKTKNLQTQVAEEKQAIQGELEKLNQEMDESIRLKKEIFETLDKGLVLRYERVLLRRQPAVAGVRGGTCQECNISIPAQMFIELQRGNEIFSCPSCNRILYVLPE